MIGDEIFTVFTPLTFNKTGFNGLRPLTGPTSASWGAYCCPPGAAEQG